MKTTEFVVEYVGWCLILIALCLITITAFLITKYFLLDIIKAHSLICIMFICGGATFLLTLPIALFIALKDN